MEQPEPEGHSAGDRDQRNTFARWFARRRVWVTLLAIAVVVVVLAGIAFVRVAPPRAARMLPDADAIVYLDLAPIRRFSHFDRQPIHHAPAYQKFIDATGFVFERDLDEAAFAIRRMPNPNGPNGAYAFSEVFVGHIDETRMRAWLHSIASSETEYREHTIYRIPSEQRTVRVAFLNHRTVAVSNTPGPGEIHSILDRYPGSRFPFSGPTLLTKYYSNVPLLSPAWAIGMAGGSTQRGVTLEGFRMPIAPGSAMIGSLHWAGKIELKVEEIAPDTDSAAESAEAARSILNVFRVVEGGLPSKPDPQLRQLIQSAKIEQHKNRATLVATIPAALLRRLIKAPDLFTPPPSGPSGGTPENPAH